MIKFKFILLSFVVTSGALASADEGKIIERYNHDYHEKNVFAANKIDCSYCHNFEFPKGSKKAILKEEITKATFVKPIRELCHSCHRNAESKYPKAPQTCYTCHTSTTNMNKIKPQSHFGVDWAGNHSLNARTAENSCVTCHNTSQCVKCHVSRNTVMQKNHTRNFRFYHSVEARSQPQRCDACHTKNYCMNCHMGRGQ
jgi:hypothetical protein